MLGAPEADALELEFNPDQREEVEPRVSTLRRKTSGPLPAPPSSAPSRRQVSSEKNVTWPFCPAGRLK